MELAKNVQVLDGTVPLLMVEEMSMEFRSNDNAVYTTALGLAGFSDGATEVMVTMRGAVPDASLGGLEVDWVARLHAAQPLTVVGGGRSTQLEGRVLSMTLSDSARNPMGWNISFHGRIVARSVVTI